MQRVIEAYARETGWLAMMRTAMQQDVGWDRSMGTYRDVYRRAIAARACQPVALNGTSFPPA